MLERRWVSCKIAGEILSLSAKHVNDLCLRGIIPSIKLGHSRRIDLRKLEAQLERQTTGQTVGRGGKK